MGQAVAGKLETHQWCLSEQLEGLAQFDPKVPAEMKKAMAGGDGER